MDIKCDIFEKNGIAKRFCDELSKKGISIEPIDANGDGLPSEKEVLDHVFDNYEKYQSLLEGTLQIPIPWMFGDVKVKGRIAEAVGILKKELTKLGYEVDSPDYLQRLAIGLVYFALLPDAERLGKLDKKTFFDLTVELEKEGLNDYLGYLRTNGGLGVYNFQERNAPLEASAAKALENGYGYCTERSNILFAVFREAGLNPFFVFISGMDIGSAERSIWDMNVRRRRIYNTLEDHAVIGLDLNGKKLYFDLTRNDYGAVVCYADKYTLPLSLREYFSVTMCNLVNDYKALGKDEEASRISELRRLLGPISIAGDSLEMEAALAPNIDSTMSLLKEAIAANPKDIRLYLKLASLYAGKDDYTSSISVIKKAFELDPFSEEVVTMLAGIFYNLGKRDEAYDLIDRLIELKPNDPLAHFLKGKKSAEEKKMEEAKAEYERAFVEDPITYNMAAIELGRIYYNNGEYDLSSQWAKKGLEWFKEPEKSTNDLILRALLVDDWLELGRLKEAELQIEKILDNYSLQEMSKESEFKMFCFMARLKFKQERWGEVVADIDKWTDANKDVLRFMPVSELLGLQFLNYDAGFHLKGIGAVSSGIIDDAGYFIKRFGSEPEEKWPECLSALEAAMRRASPQFLKHSGVHNIFIKMHETIAGLYEQRSKWREAIDVYRRIAEFAPEYAPIYLKMRDAHLALGENETASMMLERYEKVGKKFYERAFELDNCRADALEKLHDIYKKNNDLKNMASVELQYCNCSADRDNYYSFECATKLLNYLMAAGEDIAPGINYVKRMAALIEKKPYDPKLLLLAEQSFKEGVTGLILLVDDVSFVISDFFLALGKSAIASRAADDARRAIKDALEWNPNNQIAKEILNLYR